LISVTLLLTALWRLVKNTLFSSLFLALYCAMGWAGVCTAYHTSHQNLFYARMLVSLVADRCLYRLWICDRLFSGTAARAIRFRRVQETVLGPSLSLCMFSASVSPLSRRRMELALYCLPRALESFYREMVAEGKLPVYVLLSLSLSVFFPLCLQLCLHLSPQFQNAFTSLQREALGHSGLLLGGSWYRVLLRAPQQQH
jgi:hypothetical protein